MNNNSDVLTNSNLKKSKTKSKEKKTLCYDHTIIIGGSVSRVTG